MGFAKYHEDNYEIVLERNYYLQERRKEAERMESFIYSTCEDEYEQFEKRCKNHERRCIDGRLTGSNKCVGYCKFEGHPGFLTKELRKRYNCLGKGCNYYVGKPKK